MNRRRHGFLLLETMVGVAVFAVGVLVLARCMQFCLDAELVKTQDQRARVVLENRMAEIEAGAVLVEDKATEEALGGMNHGIVIRQWTTELELTDEKNNKITGIEEVHLEAVWQAPAGPQTKTLKFYVFAPQ